jgi:hypothetical protein
MLRDLFVNIHDLLGNLHDLLVVLRELLVVHRESVSGLTRLLLESVKQSVDCHGSSACSMTFS